MAEQGYNSSFALVSPEAPGIYTFAVATTGEGQAWILLLIETLHGSERHFWTLDMAKHQCKALQEQIEVADKKGGLAVVKNPSKLIVPGQ